MGIIKKREELENQTRAVGSVRTKESNGSAPAAAGRPGFTACLLAPQQPRGLSEVLVRKSIHLPG